jgi:hypothetical protein
MIVVVIREEFKLATCVFVVTLGLNLHLVHPEVVDLICGIFCPITTSFSNFGVIDSRSRFLAPASDFDTVLLIVYRFTFWIVIHQARGNGLYLSCILNASCSLFPSSSAGCQEADRFQEKDAITVMELIHISRPKRLPMSMRNRSFVIANDRI